METYDESPVVTPSDEILQGFEQLCHQDALAADLIDCFVAIFCADIATRRIPNRPRHLHVQVKVGGENITAWQNCRPLIERLACFVTKADDDRWNLSFIEQDHAFSSAMQTSLPFQGNVALLSGGLDSFCGTYDVVQKEQPTLFVGYKNNNIAASKISDTFSFVQSKMPLCELYAFDKTNVNKVVYTQRTRSLLFLALAVISARKNSIRNIYLYENGIMTLNPSFQSRGTTKTTHPKTIMLFQQILDDLGFEQKIHHPFIFHTKGEMVSALDEDFRNKIADTHSCSKSRTNVKYFKGRRGINSCGACVPCLLRKISLAAYDMEHYDHEYSIPYEGNQEDNEYRSSLLYFTTFAEAIKNQRIMQELDIRPKYYSVDDYAAKTLDMLNKFAKEVDVFVKKYGG